MRSVGAALRRVTTGRRAGSPGWPAILALWVVAATGLGQQPADDSSSAPPPDAPAVAEPAVEPGPSADGDGAQDAGAAGQVPDETALNVEFQQILERYLTLKPAPEIPGPEGLAAWRDETQTALVELIGRLASLAERSGQQPDVLMVKALCHARLARLVLDRRRELDRDYDRLKDQQRRQPTDETAAGLARLARPRLELAEQAAGEYARVDEALRVALERAEAIRAQRETGLVRGVVLTQSAIVNDRVIEAVNAAADAGVSAEGYTVRAMRALLDDAQQLLADYVAKTPKENGLEWVRGQFYLGVVEYRRSLAERELGKEYFTRVEPQRVAMFERARAIFADLSDPGSLLATLRGVAAGEGESPAERAFQRSSFAERRYSHEDVANFYAASANLYLGLIASADPALEKADPGLRRDAAMPFLTRARALDGSAATREVDPIPSLTAEMIPVSVERVTQTLEEAIAAAAVVRRQPLNDLTFTLGSSLIYDTNVPLLGRNTEAPLDKRRKRDFRVGGLLKFNYVADLDAFDESLRGGPLSKWQMLVEGRTSHTWNARIHDFNEQFYGATFNLRYELAGPGQLPSVDGLYLHWRYDYDYVLLGNDGFLRVNRVRPSLQLIALDQVLDSSLYFAYEDRNYLEYLRDARFDRDGNYFFWGFDTIVDLGKWVNGETLWKDAVWGPKAPSRDDRDWRRPLEYTIGVEFQTHSTVGDQFDYSSQVLTTGFKFPLPYGVDFSTRALWEWQDYRGLSVVDRSRRGRDDFIQEYSFHLERKFYLTRYDADYEFSQPLRLARTVMTLSGDIRFILDDSNVRDRFGQSVFEYNRIIYGAGVRFDIN